MTPNKDNVMKNVLTADGIVDISGKLSVIGTTVFTTKGPSHTNNNVVVITNNISPNVFQSGTMLAIVNDIPMVASRLSLNTYNSAPIFTGSAAQGTINAPAGLKSGNILVGLVGFGYGETKYSPMGRGRIQILASEDWSDTAQGTSISFLTTPIGSNSTISTMVLHADGILTLGTHTVSGSSNLQVIGGTSTDTLTVNGPATISGNLFLTQTTPVSSSAPGIPGEIAVDSSNIYVCVGTNSWKYVPLQSF